VVERELKVTLESVGRGPDTWPRLRVSGEVDIQTSPFLERQLMRALDGASSLTVDLSDVTFLDSTGLSVLVAGLKQCQGAGGELHLVSPRPNVLRVLEITGLTEAFHLDQGGGEPELD
jgi:anti-sigma B factor antagonist